MSGHNSTDASVIGYCEYLDKEMTIMGLLSAFAVVAGAIVIDRTLGAKPKDQPVLAELWSQRSVLIEAAAFCFFVSGLFFYIQRSLLAFYYGQLRFSLTPARYRGMNAKYILERADSWATWVSYRNGFATLSLAFVLLAFALAWPRDFLASDPTLAGVFGGAALAWMGVTTFVYRRYSTSDTPWSDLLK